MYLPISTQDNIGDAWLEAVKAVRGQSNTAHNVIIDIESPCSAEFVKSNTYSIVDTFLTENAKPLETVANTIFPVGFYHRCKRKKDLDYFFERFRTHVLPKVQSSNAWSGYYFDRMTQIEKNGEPFNPLRDIIQRIGNPKNRSRNKFELSTFDPARDVSNSPYGGQCLSFLSFKTISSKDGSDSLLLTAMYRNHYYVEKLLGNILGLTRLMEFVASETGLKVGSLTIVSTNATIDTAQIGVKVSDVDALIAKCG